MAYPHRLIDRNVKKPPDRNRKQLSRLKDFIGLIRSSKSSEALVAKRMTQQTEIVHTDNVDELLD